MPSLPVARQPHALMRIDMSCSSHPISSYWWSELLQSYAIWICEFGNACHHDSEVVVVKVLGRHWCRCCCDWSLGKMKPLADKLVVSLSGELNEREEDATTLSSSVLGNLDGERRQNSML